MLKKSTCLITLLVFVLGITSTIVGQEGVVDGLIGYWSLDENEGDTTADISGLGSEGTLHGGVTWTEGKFGSALLFSGNDSGFVDCGNSTLFEIGQNDYTISAWILAGTFSEDRSIFGKGGDNGGGIRYHTCIVGSNIKVIMDDNVNKKDPAGEILVTDSVWHNVVGIRKENKLHLWVDGVEDVALTNHARGTLEDNYDVTGTLYNAYIGCIANNNDSTLMKHFNGVIDDVAFWDRALEEDEILYLWGDGVGNVAYIPEEEPDFASGIKELEREYRLRNYPNPFSSSTTISFRLPEASHANLKVYNSLGMEVAVLVDGMRTAGINKVQFDGSDLPNGFYFARFETGSYSKTIKILLAK